MPVHGSSGCITLHVDILVHKEQTIEQCMRLDYLLLKLEQCACKTNYQLAFYHNIIMHTLGISSMYCICQCCNAIWSYFVHILPFHSYFPPL